ncbi:reverse transcriptase domain-containing protein [Tanacetum coccineum]
MHTRASNSELVEPLSEPERTLNHRLRRQNRRVPFERRDERPAQPRIVYLPILDINYFRHFLDILENYNPMDDEPMWAADRVVALIPGSAITILETANEFAIKAFTDEGRSNLNTDKIMARMNAMTMKMDTQYKEMQSRSNHLIPECDEDDKPMSPEAEAIFMKTFRSDLGASINLMPYSLYAKLSFETLKLTKMSIRLAERSFQHPIRIAENMLVEVGRFTFPLDFVILEMGENNKVPFILGRPFLDTADAIIRVNKNNSILDIDVIDEILEEDFDALLDEGSEILHSIGGTILEEKLFAEFDEFMAMNIEENF